MNGFELLSRDSETGQEYWFRMEDGKCVTVGRYTRAEQLYAQNAEIRSNKMGTRWGDGDVAARIPMNMMFDDKLGIREALRNHDHKWLRDRIFNNSDYSQWRTRDGRL